MYARLQCLAAARFLPLDAFRHTVHHSHHVIDLPRQRLYDLGLRRSEHLGRVALQLLDQRLHLCPNALHNGRLRESQDMIDRDDLRRGRGSGSASEMRCKRGQERCALPLMAVIQFHAQYGSLVDLARERRCEFG